MRFAALFVPLAISLALAAGLVIYVTMQPSSNSASPPAPAEVRHPVTAEMLREAGKMSEKPAPFFKVTDAHGKDVQIGGEGKRPQFVYFILDGCPCSLNAQPLFNRMYARYKDRADFIGVINVGKSKALDYAGETTLLHPIVCDEAHSLIRAYGAKESTYSVLIRPDGTIEKLWPGYSQGMLSELNQKLAKLTGAKPEPFDAAYAPKELSSGCFF